MEILNEEMVREKSNGTGFVERSNGSTTQHRTTELDHGEEVEAMLRC